MKAKINCKDLNDVMLQTFTYLENNERLQNIIEEIEEFKIEKFKKIDSKKSTDYYKFKKSNNSTITDIIYMLFNEKPTTYGLLTNVGAITFGLDLITSIANYNQEKPIYTTVNLIDKKRLVEIMLMVNPTLPFLSTFGIKSRYIDTAI